MPVINPVKKSELAKLPKKVNPVANSARRKMYEELVTGMKVDGDGVLITPDEGESMRGIQLCAHRAAKRIGVGNLRTVSTTEGIFAFRSNN